MKFNDFSRILGEIKKLINKNYVQFGLCESLSVFYDVDKFLILRIDEIIKHGNYSDLKIKTNMGAEVIYEQKFENCIFIELIKLINECKKRFGHGDKFEDLLEDLRNCVEFQDALETL